MQITQILKVEVEVTYENIKDMYQTACYGGINYWCMSAEIDTNGDGAILGFRFFDIEDERWCYAEIEKFARAMVEYASEKKKTFASLMNNYDAGDADAIVQKAVFGKIIYG